MVRPTQWNVILQETSVLAQAFGIPKVAWYFVDTNQTEWLKFIRNFAAVAKLLTTAQPPTDYNNNNDK